MAEMEEIKTLLYVLQLRKNLRFKNDKVMVEYWLI
jgi:hypothetical protein